MRKLVLLFTMFVGLALAQPTFFGDLNVGHHFNPGVGVSLPFSSNVNVPVEVNRAPGATAFTAGVSVPVATINGKTSVGVITDLGPNVTPHGTHTLIQFGASVTRRRNQKWSYTYYVKNSRYLGNGSWSGGLTVNFKR